MSFSIIPEPTKLIVFDWDGTLMDSTGRIVSAMQQTARNLELAIPNNEAVKGIIGLGLTECFNILFPNLSCHKAITEEYRYQYVEGDKTPSPLFSGTEQMLHKLKNSNYLLAVATGKARHGLDRVLDATGLRSVFDDTIGADEAEQGKPHPEMLQLLMKRIGVNAEQTLMIGDTTFDLEMASNAQVASIGVTCGAHKVSQLESHKPLTLLNYVSELGD